MRILTSMILGLLLSTAADAANFALHSTGFSDDGAMPDIYTCQAGNQSPELHWSGAPANTQSFTLILSSLDTPVGLLYTWVVYNIPSTSNKLTQGGGSLPDGAVVGTNDLYEMGYRGPCPADKKVHQFIFTLYALDTLLELPGSANAEDVLDKMQGHILQQTQLKATFKH